MGASFSEGVQIKYPHASYTGGIRNDLQVGVPEGDGFYEAKGQGIYEGHWNNGLQSGKGLLLDRDGTGFCGQWKNGRRDGYGVEILPSGLFFEGFFKNDEYDGLGLIRDRTCSLFSKFRSGLPGEFLIEIGSSGCFMVKSIENTERDFVQISENEKDPMIESINLFDQLKKLRD
jgi:hypothetical protein